ncbi:phenylalanine--tRNA ligase subunit beta [Fluoribacter dumoffii]|uniref:Phenylalanine--tRNA ligase beta subunit n=1 Tax=Fluoribacter dumoffii TaxID=463 RepID=A0A377G5Z3_9GAMM|nr:phenylalanine--tRNA ligase subunit beta [Fluoribacter dumoffii]KTC92536.1 phenylalanyl-tRNA synthetase, beta subunit [Fluoribacter dumoffii NY 23]MCW8387112.1 phenylalanine--tRNA ligase subunit beta [Fluoribacter dumoffii]MCW8497315.1 phenylalanine--tRNA ligase subunit beta [Fluoribacter dumoffii]STO20232.1 Phenylalanine--tRNA ligase beta subunit [Fluoribacter dumoffii]
MKLSKLWLREWVNFSLTEQELAHQLTMAGLEVDAVSPVAGEFTQVIVAEVLSTKPHPNADKLTLCEVNANTGKPLQIVCGASNVRAGLKVALAMVGARLPGGFNIKESKLRGELSQGMLCSVSELGMAEHSEGILELEKDAPVGMDLREYLTLDDHIFDVDLTPNRADCFSVLGIAREVAVLNKLPLLQPSIEEVTPSIDDVLSIQLKNPEACPRYCGRVIRNINSKATTPLWMGERLRRGGIRTLHPVVDVMNYVMLELGQPMHAFDLETIKDEINVRFSNSQEQLQLLDGQELTLNDKVLVIADQEKPLALAGIMGGEASSVQAHTRNVFLESAYFNPVVIAGVARKFGLFSDSSQRFERGVDPCLQMQALERATALILSIAGGEAGPVIESYEQAHLPEIVSFTFDTDKVKKLTGLEISLQEMKNLLGGLGIVVSKEHHNFLDVIIPSHRFDIQQDVDLVEEIIRLYGYDNLHAQPATTFVQSGTTCGNEEIAAKLSRWFSNRGYHETISYSFVDPELQHELYPQKEFMQLLNPISSELSQMRAGMWPGLIASMIYNVHRQQNAVKFFEIGVVFDVNKGQLIERPCVAGLLMGEQGGVNWCESTRAFDFFDLKGDLQSLFASLKLKHVEFVAAAHDALHPGQSAQIKINGVPAGWMGMLHPRLTDALDLQDDVLIFEINLAALLGQEAPRYKTISKYPQIRRDLSFLVDSDVSVMQIEAVVRTIIKENWLKSFDVFDVYTGEGVPKGKKSLAVAMTLQDESRTLVDAEINSLISAIINTLENEFSIILRE